MRSIRARHLRSTFSGRRVFIQTSQSRFGAPALPAQGHPNPERAVVHFEYSGPDEDFAKTELGEAGIPTQIDVAVEGIFSRDVRHMQFIEVKLSESGFGS